jgi:CelD/BcsL family acetyltransferase involved in cellulose biosynthesis
MSKLGPVELVQLRTWNAISSALPAFEQAQIARFRAQGKESPLVDDERRRFIAELARLLATQRWVTLSCLMLGGRPVAWNYGFEFAGSWFWYQPTFEESVARYSPGSCLLASTILEACDRKDVNRIDLGLGEEGYKERFATSHRRTQHVTVTASSARYVKETLRYRAASTIKSSPRMENYVRRILAHWHTGPLA